MVANDVSREGSGFGGDANAAVLLDAQGETELPLMSKRELAEQIWDRVERCAGRARLRRARTEEGQEIAWETGKKYSRTSWSGRSTSLR